MEVCHLIDNNNVTPLALHSYVHFFWQVIMDRHDSRADINPCITSQEYATATNHQVITIILHGIADIQYTIYINIL